MLVPRGAAIFFAKFVFLCSVRNGDLRKERQKEGHKHTVRETI